MVVVQEESFSNLKTHLASVPILQRSVRGRPYQLHTDWSKLKLGAMLTQHDDKDQEFVVALCKLFKQRSEVKV